MSEAEQYTNQQASDPQTPPQVLADIAALRADLRPAVAANPSAYPGLLQWLGSLGEPAVDTALRSRAAASAAEPRTAPGPSGQPWQGPSTGAAQGYPGAAPATEPYPGGARGAQGYGAGQGGPGATPAAPYGGPAPAYGGPSAPGAHPAQPSGLGAPPSATAYGSAPGGYGVPAGQYGAQQPGQQPYGAPAGQQPYGAPAGQQPYGAPAGQQPYGAPAGAPQQTRGSKKGLWITLAVLGVLALLVAGAILVWNLVSDQLPDMTEGTDAELEALYDRCAEGDGQACDDLYFKSPAGSEYEEFGDTCGGRTDGGSLCVNELD